MITITIPDMAKDTVVEALKAQAWEIARKTVNAMDIEPDSFLAAAFPKPDMMVVRAQIDSLMNAAAEIDGIQLRGPWADGLMLNVRSDIASLEARLTDAEYELSQCERDTDACDEARDRKDRINKELMRLTAL